MLRDYPALGLFLKSGRFIVVFAGLLVLVTGIAALAHVDSNWFWGAVCFVCAVLVAGLVAVLRELVKVVVETLIPAP